MNAPASSQTIFYNANVLTMDPARPRAAILAVRGRELVYVGQDRDAARKLLGPEAALVDLEGRQVIPGLTDGHSHLISEGMKLAEVDVHGLSKEETLAVIGREAARLPAGAWIKGLGWNQEKWPGGLWPTKEDLDRVAPDHPVILDRMDKHSAWVNSLALKAAGLNDDSPDPPGGEFLRDQHGRLQGILIGWAMFSVMEVVPPVTEENRRQALLRGQAAMFENGLTSLMVAGATLPDLELMENSYQTSDLKIRIRAWLLVFEGADQAYLAQGRRPVYDLFEERFSVAGFKIHSDGSLGSRSAWLLEDYADRPGHRGGRAYDDRELAAIMKRARDNGFQVSIHAIGDAAVRQAVETMAQVLGPKPGDHRWRIEHFQVVTEKDLARAVALGIVPSLQTVGLMGDMDMAEDRLGPEVIKRSYAWRSLIDQGGRPVNGSDGPVESINPFWGMYAAVTRQNLDGRPAGGWYPEHRLSRLEALAGYTTWAAWSEFAENRKGSLSPGKLADFTVIDRDMMTCPESEIKDITVLRTVVGGQTVYQRP